MSTVTKPIALDESFNTTELTPRNIADVLAEGLSHITGRTASEVEYDNSESELTADNVQDALDEIAESVPTLPTTDIQTAVDEFSTYNGGLLSECKVALSPNQDLHGYENPWVGGAGKNKAPLVDKTGYGLTFVADELLGKMTMTGTATSDGRGAGIIVQINLPVGSYICSATNNPNNAQVLINYIPQGVVTSSGVTFNVTDATQNIRVAWLIASGTTYNNVIEGLMIRSATETAGFAPYSNICPISGHTQVEVQNHQKNLCDNSANIIGLWESDGTYHDNLSYRTSDLIEVSANTEYSVSLFDLSTNTRVNGLVVTEWDANSEIIGQVDGNILTTTANTKYVRIRNYGANSALVQTSNYAYQLELGSTATAYEPYNGYQVTVNLGGTYYSGTLDVVSGVLTVDTAKQTYPWGTYTRTDDLGNTRRRILATLSDALGTVSSDIGANISDSVEEQTGWTTDSPHFYIDSSNKTLVVFLPISTPDSTNIEVCYKLATPTPIQLSPTMVKALVGENHLSAPLEGQEITESKYKQIFTFDDVIAYIQSLS